MKQTSLLISTLFLLTTLTFSASTLANTDDFGGQNEPTSVNSSIELYENVDQVFSAYHNKFLGAVFGKQNLATIISTESETIADEIEKMSSTEFQSLITPFPSQIGSVMLSVLLAFFTISSIYISWTLGKFIIERLWMVTVSEKNSSGVKSTGGELQLIIRFFIAVGIIFPTATALNKAINGKMDESSNPANDILFKLIGNSMNTSELISRTFIGGEQLYNPFYSVPTPDYLVNQFKRINDYASCVVSNGSARHVDLKTSFYNENISPERSEVFIYESNYGNCSLRIKVKNDVSTISLLQQSKELEEVSGISAYEYAKAAQDNIKEQLDTYLVHSLNAFTVLTDKFYDENGDVEELETTVKLKMTMWQDYCDKTFKSMSNSDKYAEVLHAAHKAPYCYSKKYIEKLAYPAGSDFDKSVMDKKSNALKDAEKGRLVSLCPDLTGGVTEEAFAGCVKQKCQSVVTKSEQGSGIFECAVGIGALSEVMGLRDYASGGFLLAPLYNQHRLQLEIDKSNKNYVNSLDTAFDSSDIADKNAAVTVENRGTLIWSHTFEERGDNDLIETFNKMYVTSFSGPDAMQDYPDYNASYGGSGTALISRSLSRMVDCLDNAGGMLPHENSVCGTNYQEGILFLEKFTVLATTAYVLSLVNFQKAKDLLSSKGGNMKGSSIFDKPVVKNMLLGALGAIGLGQVASLFLEVNSFDDLTYVMSGSVDPFDPAVSSIVSSTAGEQIIVLIVAILAQAGFISALLSAMIVGCFFFWLAFKYIPALMFLIAITNAFLNLMVFVLSLPFQIASAYAEAGAEGLRKVKRISTKLLLTLIRFPLIVTGFYLSFALFDAALPVYLYAMSQTTLQMSADSFLAEFLTYIALTLIFGAVLIGFSITCIGAINTLYDNLKGYLTNDNNESQAEDAIGMMKEASSTMK